MDGPFPRKNSEKCHAARALSRDAIKKNAVVGLHVNPHHGVFMSSSLRWKITLLLCVTIFAGLTVAPSFTTVPAWWQKYLAPAGLKLGLDLQGGMHLVLKVDLKKAIENNLDLSVQDLKEALAEKKITVVRKIILPLPNTGALETVKQTIDKEFPDLAGDFQTVQGTFPRIILSLKQ